MNKHSWNANIITSAVKMTRQAARRAVSYLVVLEKSRSIRGFQFENVCTSRFLQPNIIKYYY